MSLATKIALLRKELGAAATATVPTGDELRALEEFVAETGRVGEFELPRSARALPFAASDGADVRRCIVALVRADGERRAALAALLRERGFDVG